MFPVDKIRDESSIERGAVSETVLSVRTKPLRRVDTARLNPQSLPMHETFTKLEAPTARRLLDFLEWFGHTARSFDDFDILRFPDAVPWTSLMRYSIDKNERYVFEETATPYVGSEISRTLELEASEDAYSDSDEESKDRWEPFFWQAVSSREPVFAKTFVHGIDKEYLFYEVGGFPFLNEEGLVSHVILIMAIL